MPSDSPLLDDPRFIEIARRLVPAPLPPPSDDVTARKQAAVSIILRPRDTLDLLVIRRAEAEHDPWSGHMALPGGRWEPGDDSLLETAIRETREEVGIELGGHPTLGRLESVSPQTRRLPTLEIQPFVFGVPDDTEAELGSPEVASVHWIGLHELVDPANRRDVDIPLIGTVRPFPAFVFDDRVIWGLTYRILTRFLGLVPADEEP